MSFKFVNILGIFFLYFSCSTDQPQQTYSNDKSDISSYNLIDPQLANELLKEHPDKYVPIQVSKMEAFNKEHIPNAKNIWRPDYGSDIKEPYGGLIPTKEKLEKLLQRLNYKKGNTLLLYDVKANVDAFRFAWVLNLYGFQDFKIINGGLKYWKLNNFEVTSDVIASSETSDYQLSEYFDNSIIAEFDELMEAIKDTNTVLIDTREPYEYEGLPFVSKDSVLSYKKGAFNRGSIPTAIHLNWSSLADLNGDHRIKSEKDLRYNLKQNGINPNKNIILYCQSGSRTSHTYYVLKHVLGYKNVKNYDGSWIEWSYRHSIDNSIPLLQICSDERHSAIKDSLTSSLINHE